MQRFTEHVVIVTGAGFGIDEATACRFSQEGVGVVLARDLPPERTLVKVTNFSNYMPVQALVAATVERFGALHVMSNNAGSRSRAA